MAEIIIDDNTPLSSIQPPQALGLIPRNHATHPLGCYASAPPFDLPLIPESEWQSRLDAINAAKARLSDVRNRGKDGQPMPSRDQDGYGYCWCHSTVSAMLIVRAKMNQPYADLSAFHIGCIIKGYRNQGGRGAESMEFAAEKGCATSATWPQQSTQRGNDKAEMWADAAKYRITEWMDLGRSKERLVTCLLMGIPVVSDFNWWSHSVCTVDLVSINPFRTRIWNSWGDSWSENGMGILEGNRAIPDDALAPRLLLAS